MKVENNIDCFVGLWRELELTRLRLKEQHRRFTVRRVLQTWFGDEATDQFIWEVCRLSELTGLDEMRPPAQYPRRHRELLRAVVATRLGIGLRHIDLKALDEAYSIAFPKSTPLNINKKKRSPP